MRHLKQAQHTPGPWDVSIGPPEHLTKAPRAIKTRIVRGPLGKAEGIIGLVEYSIYGARNADEAEANARLMAAAPDLLEAAKLQEEASFLDSRLSNRMPKEEYYELGRKADELREKACLIRRAAILKAEGGK